MRAKQQRLYINIDHVATLRQARRAAEPDPVEAAIACEAAGADGITAHLREDRRHIQDADVTRLKEKVRTYFNLEMACVSEMVELARRIKPEQVTLVPERREEVTTEGGLDIISDPARIRKAIEPVSSAAFARFLADWHGIGSPTRGAPLGRHKGASFDWNTQSVHLSEMNWRMR